MQSRPANSYARDTIDRLTNLIPLFRQLRAADANQYELLVQHSWLVSYGPEETVLLKGSDDRALYFLLKGQVRVMAANDDQEVNLITPGEVFGDLAVLLNQPRTATVVADSNCREVLVFATDISSFGQLEDFSRVSLTTKLAYYRNLVHSLRWKLEVYRTRYADHAMADQHRKVKLFTGKKDTEAELIALSDQAKCLAELLVSWNDEFGRLPSSDITAPTDDVLAPLAM